ncbi:MAG: hypothetical protein AUK47_22460 [Deltaproteobacteria bacterium CG2_30_63_29]|nr:MAG: hypothetical protein AUK47_22460 [Deltaproteobacteria bacterium CG2_30_63_29]PJB40862.1 MAG: hypothetical protein CO108_13925 [Deltaproteobacteria bacterium CG_4_9_14_3_um_filter_63_12]
MGHNRQTLPLALVALMGVTLFCSPLRADISKKQKKLNEKAVEQMMNGNYDDAVSLLEQSLAIGELNITYLNLGRAYAKAGRCQEALVAYDRMAVAPRVKSPSPDELYKVLVTYRDDLKLDCPGKVVIRCRPTEILVGVDGGNLETCPDQVFDLEPGEHIFYGEVEGVGSVERTETVIGMTTIYVDLVLDRPIQQVVAPQEVQKPQESSALPTLGWGALGLGGGLLIAGLVTDLAVISPLVEEFDSAKKSFDSVRASALKDSIDTQQSINTAVFITGATFLAVGTGLLVYDLMGDSEGDAKVSLAPNGARVSVRF